MRFLFFICICLSFFSPVRAETEKDREKELLGLHYVPANYESLSRISWRFNVLPFSDDGVIDSYLKIADCNLYSQYYEDEFLWQHIREGKRRELRYYSPHFPDRFELVGGIALGRYDFQTASFIIPEEYSLTRAGVLSIPIDRERFRACDINKPDLVSFPPWINFLADNPFDFRRIPMLPSKAKELIERLEKRVFTEKFDPRIAVMRVRIHVTGVNKYSPHTLYPQIVYKGQLDEIAVFEDPAMTKLIWKRNFKVLD